MEHFLSLEEIMLCVISHEKFGHISSVDINNKCYISHTKHCA